MEEKLMLAEFRTLIRTAGIELNEVALSDELLCCFLQARQNKLDCAFDLFRNYYRMAVKNPNLMAPFLINHKTLLDFNFFFLSPFRDEKSECRVVFNKNYHDINNFGLSAEELFRGLVTGYQYLISKAETRRIILVMDVKDASFRDFKKFGSFIGLKIPSLFNNAFPIRFHEIHILNEHFVAKLMTKIMWPFLSENIRNRIHFHGSSLESFHRYVSPSCLPSEYGGSLGPIDRMNLSKFVAENSIENIFDCLNQQLFL